MNNLSYVWQIDVNITDLCNKTCSFCPRHDPEIYPNNNQHMPVELFKKIIDECLEVGYDKDILLCGRGEPSLHKDYEQILKLLHHPDRKWKTNLTTNGRNFDKYYDFYTNNFDFVILNTYTTQEEYDERVKKYGWKLNTSERHLRTDKPRNMYNLEHYFKPTGADVDEVNSMTGEGFTKGFELPAKPDVTWKHSFNKRCGLQDDIKVNPAIKDACGHPLEFLFLNFDGKIHMCCNDWGSGGGKGQTIVGDFTKDTIWNQYRRSKKRAKIVHNLLNGRRYNIEACSKCEVANDLEKTRCSNIVKGKHPNDSTLLNYLGKLLMTEKDYYDTDRDMENINRNER